MHHRARSLSLGLFPQSPFSEIQPQQPGDDGPRGKRANGAADNSTNTNGAAWCVAAPCLGRFAARPRCGGGGLLAGEDQGGEIEREGASAAAAARTRTLVVAAPARFGPAVARVQRVKRGDIYSLG